MEAVKYYELKFYTTLTSAFTTTLRFDTLLQAKQCVKHIVLCENVNRVKLYKVVGDWDMSTGQFTFTTTQVTSW